MEPKAECIWDLWLLQKREVKIEYVLHSDIYLQSHERNVLTKFAAIKILGLVVQSIISLMSSFSGQHVKCFTTLLPNTLIFFVEKKLEKQLLTFFQQKILTYMSY